MSDIKNNAESIWDRRYQDGELACTQEQVVADPIDYTQHPFLYKQSVAKRVTGDTEGVPLQMIAEQYLRPAAKKMLAVGSGLAFAEEMMVKGGYVERLVAFESSAAAVDAARERFKAIGLHDKIEMRCGDVMSAGLRQGEFDAVFVQAAIHHFYNIEEMFQLFHFVLKPGGLILYDEYIGPDHHMYEPEVMDLMDEVNECLAEPYRWDMLRKSTREEIPRPTMEWMLEMDPSEGVHSSKILPLTYKYFDVEFRRDYGGTFMRPFFVGILPNFNFSDEKDQTISRLIILMEELLIRNGTIPSYHTRVVGRKRESPGADMSSEECERINYSDWPGYQKYGSPTSVPRVAGYSASNYSDANWKSGVGILGGAVIFLAASKRAKSDFVIGKLATFTDNDKRLIIDVKENDGSLIISFSGDDLDPNIAGYPNLIKVSETQHL